MHLLHLYFENAQENGDGELCLERRTNEVAKWTLLASGQASRELLRMIAIACGGTRLLPHLPFALEGLCRGPGSPLQIECILAVHPRYRSQPQDRGIWGSGIRMDEKGLVRNLRREEYRFLPYDMPIRRAKTGIGDSWLFLLGYGPEPKHHDGTDDFDFTNPLFRLTRFQSLFLDGSPLTDPVAFLTRIHYRGAKHKRLGSRHTLERLSRVLKEHFAIDTTNWMEEACDFKRQWLSLAPWQQRTVLPALDAARHLLDAYPKHSKPLDIPGLILFDRPDQMCTEELFPRWARLMDELFPEMQFVVSW